MSANKRKSSRTAGEKSTANNHRSRPETADEWQDWAARQHQFAEEADKQGKELVRRVDEEAAKQPSEWQDILSKMQGQQERQKPLEGAAQAREKAMRELFSAPGCYDQFRKARDCNDTEQIKTIAKKQWAQLHTPEDQAKFLRGYGALLPDIAAEDPWYQQRQSLIPHLEHPEHSSALQEAVRSVTRPAERTRLVFKKSGRCQEDRSAREVVTALTAEVQRLRAHAKEGKITNFGALKARFSNQKLQILEKIGCLPEVEQETVIDDLMKGLNKRETVKLACRLALKLHLVDENIFKTSGQVRTAYDRASPTSKKSNT